MVVQRSEAPGDIRSPGMAALPRSSGRQGNPETNEGAASREKFEVAPFVLRAEKRLDGVSFASFAQRRGRAASLRDDFLDFQEGIPLSAEGVQELFL